MLVYQPVDLLLQKITQLLMRLGILAKVEQRIRRIEEIVVGPHADGEKLVMSVLIAKSDVGIQADQQRFQCFNKCTSDILKASEERCVFFACS
jgi:hypothetical protein